MSDLDFSTTPARNGGKTGKQGTRYAGWSGLACKPICHFLSIVPLPGGGYVTPGMARAVLRVLNPQAGSYPPVTTISGTWFYGRFGGVVNRGGTPANPGPHVSQDDARAILGALGVHTGAQVEEIIARLGVPTARVATKGSASGIDEAAVTAQIERLRRDRVEREGSGQPSADAEVRG